MAGYTKAQLQAQARRIARKYGIPEAGFLAQIGMESGWNPNARSPAGAIGIAQFMPGTAKAVGVNPLDPISSLEGMGKHMSTLKKNLGSWKLALAGYNAGGGAVQKYGGVPPYRETQNYVNKLFPAYQQTGMTGPAAAAGRTVSSGGSMGGNVDQSALQSAAGHVDVNALMAVLTRTAQATLQGKAPGPEYMQALSRIIGTARINPQAEVMGQNAASTGRVVAGVAKKAKLGNIPLQPGVTPIDNQDWGGTKAAVLALAPLAFSQGLKVSSHKRDRQMTASGGVSDHYKGNPNAYAFDLGWGGASPIPAADRAASAIVAALGGPKNWGARGGVFNIVRNGIRYQVLYRTNQGGNHYNHIHLGARRV